jgi:hypothetical protein
MNKNKSRKAQLARSRPTENRIGFAIVREQLHEWLQRIDVCETQEETVKVLYSLIMAIESGKVDRAVISGIIQNRSLKQSMEAVYQIIKGKNGRH